MKTLMFVLASAGLLSGCSAGGSTAAQALPEMAVYKDAACGCCSKWVEHVQMHGFRAAATNVDDLDAVKARHGIPRGAQSCHTAVVDGYAIEGHVPAADIQRLLKERPAIVGLAVPAMPVGSPGMEVPGVTPQPYDVLALHKDGKVTVFSSYNK
jgi:hypothetical protein